MGLTGAEDVEADVLTPEEIEDFLQSKEADYVTEDWEEDEAASEAEDWEEERIVSVNAMPLVTADIPPPEPPVYVDENEEDGEWQSPSRRNRFRQRFVTPPVTVTPSTPGTCLLYTSPSPRD